ncbi:hypothetical protein AAZX31_07G093800 [Glycine max]|uniref:HMA domain-containing protein n=2 Tax=Glycine subgen. Soja TaxID=1462606 RepID=K7L0Q9_SOYBN|nr:heavy metal-associated isoprenylated plant protein 47 isoform X2 [Glycine max]XP_028240459.1 heavy metal-associated isoprenylated plant protein 47-like isoform X2 [Glycine soja]KAG5009443.1 hypothetical protein JHK87_017958 [Glycine soja]KAH1086172.1 hypothetical protein GYH30_017919 [Glycine max]KAH1241276.1 Heavy metal-associated isoprenylated plant protein 46 [Glycine max]KHN44586.1 hypothetical protein glysoja_027197 [Glycine soja]KRH48579.1 hypothetical protein GLYMA_07G098500v4 [Glyc|eukprot:XP_006583442.1 heavy metal-associated isoprenylated plant protein 47 [Glycine max]
MKQKIVLQMQLDSDKSRSKALKIAAQEIGVSSVALEGDNKDKLTVTGDVDAVHLGRVLRKKFQCVTLVSVEEVKKKDDNKCKIEIEDDKGCYYYTPYCAPPPCGPSPYCHPVYDSYDSTCSIM